MNLRSRLKKLDQVLPKCRPGIMRLSVEGQVPSELDRCRLCRGSHVLYIEEVIVESREEAEMVAARNR